MKKIIYWINAHKGRAILITLGIFFLPLFVVHILFKCQAIQPWLSAEWSAGELLAYIAGFEALLGTIILGVITVYQAEQAQSENTRLSKENNYMQKITIQPLLPLLKVQDVFVADSIPTQKGHCYPENMFTVGERVTFEERKNIINVDIHSNESDNVYVKEVHFTLKNLSDSAIRQIAVDKIMFSGFEYAGEKVKATTCIGAEKYKFINELILPDEAIEVTVRIYFDDLRYRKFWEFHDECSVGNFDIWLYLTNMSIAGIEFQEQIVIKKSVGYKEKVMYRAYSEEDNANT